MLAVYFFRKSATSPSGVCSPQKNKTFIKWANEINITPLEITVEYGMHWIHTHVVSLLDVEPGLKLTTFGQTNFTL